MSAASLLETARAAGLSFEVEGQDLIVEADRDPPAELIASLRQHKTELIAFLAPPRGRPSPGPKEEAAQAEVPVGVDDLVEKPAAITQQRGRIVPRPSDRVWWRDFYDERAAHREIDGQRPRIEAERLAWGEAQWRWYLAHGERVSREVCAGCRRPIGSAPALDLIDGNRVHCRAGHDCLIHHGERWRSVATAALLAMGLAPPAEAQ